MAPESFGSYLGHYLEHTGRAFTALTMSQNFKGRQCDILANTPSYWAVWWPLFVCTQSAASTEESVDRTLTKVGHQLPIARGCQCLVS